MGIFAVDTMVTIDGNTIGVSSGTLRESAGQYVWKTKSGAGSGAFGAGAVGGPAVTLEKIQEIFWIAAN